MALATADELLSGGAAPAPANAPSAEALLTGVPAGGETSSSSTTTAESPSRFRRLAAAAIRTVPPLATAVVTKSPWASGAVSALSESLAQDLLGESYPWQIGTQALLGAIPGLPVAKEVGPVARAALRAGEGALLGAGGTAATRLAEGKGLPSAEELLIGGGVGTLLGGGAGALEGRTIRRLTEGRAAEDLGTALRPLGTAAGRTRQVAEQAVSGEQTQAALEGLGATPHVPGAGEPVALPSALREERVAVGTSGEVAQGAKGNLEALTKTAAAARGERVFRQVSEAFAKGDIDAAQTKDILQRHGLSLERFAGELAEAYSSSGRQLQQLSALKQHLVKMAARNPELKGAINALARSGADEPSRVARFFLTLDNTRRGLLTTQVATSVRNFLAQNARYSLEALDRGLQAAATTRGGPIRRVGAGFRTAAQFSASFMRALKPEEVQQLDFLLERAAPAEKGRLFYTAAGEATLGSRLTRALNALNELQESFYRRALFDGNLRNGLRDRGLDVAAHLAAPDTIPEDLIAQSVTRALEGTFAANPTDRLGKTIVESWRAMRPIATLVNPFPRFFANSLKFLVDFNPLGVAQLMTKGGRARTPEVLSRAFLGTTMLAGALGLRTSSYRGEKWYELRVGDKRIDTRAFAPFAQYLFFAEVLTQAKEHGPDPRTWTLAPADWIQGMLSVNRIAGTGLSILDAVVGQTSLDGFIDRTADVAAQYLGGFAVPFATFRDAIAEHSRDEATLRDTRAHFEIPTDRARAAEDVDVLTRPFRQYVPGLSRSLPSKPSLFEGHELRSESPLLRQLTGLSVQTRAPLQAEVNRLGVPFGAIAPKTGIPLADRELARRMGKVLEVIGPRLLESPQYRALPDDVRVQVLQDVFTEAKKLAGQQLAQERPRLAAAIARRRKDKDLVGIFTSRGMMPTERELLQGETDQPTPATPSAEALLSGTGP